MSERRSSSAIFFMLIMLFASTAPLALASASDSTDSSAETEPYDAGGIIIGDLDDFDPSTGSEYLFIHEDEPVVSATQFMRQAWIDAGRPALRTWWWNLPWPVQLQGHVRRIRLAIR